MTRDKTPNNAATPTPRGRPQAKKAARRATALGKSACLGFCSFILWLGPRFVSFWRHWRDKPAAGHSLRLRLSLFFAVFLTAAWLVAAFFAWQECRKYINEFFDTQQLLFAKRIAAADLTAGLSWLPETRDIIPGGKKRAWGEQEEDSLAFAVFTREGKQVLSDTDKGRHFIFAGQARGFVNTPIRDSKKLWRIVWIESANRKYLIAVGQQLEYRFELALDMLAEQIAPWLILLPVLLCGLLVLLARELAPLQAVATNLRTRAPDDSTLLDEHSVPTEVRPMVRSLNGLFTRTGALLTRERSFISDAAHELRTPLAGLRVQAQVAEDPEIDQDMRQEALANLRIGIDRSARLVEQLLALSRLEAMGNCAIDSASLKTAKNSASEPAARLAGLECTKLDWSAMLHVILDEYRPRAEKKHITVTCVLPPEAYSVQGYPALAAMLVRNLVDNAVAYTPEGGSISMELGKNTFLIKNDARALSAEEAARLGERFFRPPGHEHPGSGLGLSIVRRIAELHGFTFDMTIENGVFINKVEFGARACAGFAQVEPACAPQKD